MTDTPHCLSLRLAGPLQSWGSTGGHNRRDTAAAPTKSALVGLLAAADGRRRTEPIEDLVALSVGVRSDQPGRLLRDYHTVSNWDGTKLRAATVTAGGIQNRSSTGGNRVTERFYLADAVFVAVIGGPEPLLRQLTDAIRNPTFALSLGRRSCPPTHPLCLPANDDDLWTGNVPEVLDRIPWQAGPARRRRASRDRQSHIDVAIAYDSTEGTSIAHDVPATFDPKSRRRAHRRVATDWVTLPTGVDLDTDDVRHGSAHDPFVLLGD